MWRCICDCGNEVVVSATNLKNDNTKSCGCFAIDNGVKRGKESATHGMSRTRIYKIYRQMKARCYSPKKDNYGDYGGRGIRICDEWLGENGFDNFLKWSTENGYDDDLEIDRIDNDGNYEPCNCRWVTKKINMRNRRASRYIENTPWGRITIAELSERINGDYNLIYSQVSKGIHSVDEIISMYKDTNNYDGPKYKHRYNKGDMNGD